MIWGLFFFFLINSKEEAFSWREIGCGKKIGKVEGSRWPDKAPILESLGLKPLSLSRAVKCEACLGTGICKAPPPGGSDAHPDGESFRQREEAMRCCGKEERMGRYTHTHTLGPGNSSKQRRGRIINLGLEGLHLSIVKAVSSPERARGRRGA